MGKNQKLVQVDIDIPDDCWAELVRITGETDPNKVADIALKELVKHHVKSAKNRENRHA